jgi:outer membrane receptor protein involved in Fe transport
MAAALVNADHMWHSSDRTDWEMKAVFGEVTWHATDQLNVTIGGRWFETTNDKLYTKHNFGHTDPSNNRQIGGFPQPLWRGHGGLQTATLDEFVPKFSVTYTLSDDKMVYGLYSQGFRVGGTNRTARGARWDRTLWGQVWEPDKLNNYEIGLKSRWADDTVQLNLTYFYMDWEDFQHEVVDPSVGQCVVPAEAPTCAPAPGTTRDQATVDEFDVSPSGRETLPWLYIVGNVGEAHATGVTAELAWVPAEGWDIGVNAQWLEREIDSTTASPEAGIVPGMELPNTPDFQGAAWGTYTWPVQFVRGAKMFARAQYSYTGSTLTTLVPGDLRNPQFVMPSYSIADLRFGLVSGDGDWQLDLFVNNVTDERAQITEWNSTNEWLWGRSGEYEHSHNVVTVRPREYGLRFFSRWGD